MDAREGRKKGWLGKVRRKGGREEGWLGGWVGELMEGWKEPKGDSQSVSQCVGE